MGSGYHASIDICSDFCKYTSEQMEKILVEIIESWRDPITGLGLRASEIKVKITY